MSLVNGLVGSFTKCELNKEEDLMGTELFANGQATEHEYH